jgi:hypothetical protein
MAEVSTAAAPEGVLHRRIEFHHARRPHSAVAVGGGGFQMDTLNPEAPRARLVPWRRRGAARVRRGSRRRGTPAGWIRSSESPGSTSGESLVL